MKIAVTVSRHGRKRQILNHGSVMANSTDRNNDENQRHLSGRIGQVNVTTVMGTQIHNIGQHETSGQHWVGSGKCGAQVGTYSDPCHAIGSSGARPVKLGMYVAGGRGWLPTFTSFSIQWSGVWIDLKPPS